MKKIFVIALTLLVLVGCTSSKGYSKISNGDEIIFKTPDSTYTKNDLYNVLKVASEESIEQDILNKIADSLDLDLSKIESEAEETMQMYISIGYEQSIISSFGSLDAYKQLIISSGKLEELAKKYINDKYSEFINEDKPVKMQFAYFDNQEAAQKLIDDVNKGSTFESSALTNGYQNNCQVNVYLDSDETLPLDVKSYLNDTANTGLSTIITVTTTSNDADGKEVSNETYYVLNVVSRTADEFKEDYIDTKLNNIDVKDVKEYMFETHDIKFYDQDIYEIMKKEYEVLQ